MNADMKEAACRPDRPGCSPAPHRGVDRAPHGGRDGSRLAVDGAAGCADHRAAAGARHAGDRGQRDPEGFFHLSRRPWLGAGVQRGAGACARGRHPDAVRPHRGSGRQARRSDRGDRPRPYQAVLDQATAKRDQDAADLANARHDLERYTSLAKQDFASRQQVDTQAALVNHLVAALAGDDAAIESAKLNLSFCYITSPIDGRVGLRKVDAGNLVHATDATGIVTITQVHPISVTFTLPQENLPQVTAAMAKGKLGVLAYSSDDQTRLDSGELLTPDNAIDPTTGTIKLKATFPNAASQLWPGQFVNARLLVTTLHECSRCRRSRCSTGRAGCMSIWSAPTAR